MSINCILSGQIIANSGGKTISYYLPVEATEENQTIFPINLNTFDAVNDNIFVQDGRTLLLLNSGFTLNGKTVVVDKGWNIGDKGVIVVLKNVQIPQEEVTFSGALIEEGSIPLSKLAEMPTTDGITPDELATTLESYATIEQVNAVEAKIPVITAGTEDLIAGVSELADGHIYLVYE